MKSELELKNVLWFPTLNIGIKTVCKYIKMNIIIHQGIQRLKTHGID